MIGIRESLIVFWAVVYMIILVLVFFGQRIISFAPIAVLGAAVVIGAAIVAIGAMSIWLAEL